LPEGRFPRRDEEEAGGDEREIERDEQRERAGRAQEAARGGEDGSEYVLGHKITLVLSSKFQISSSKFQVPSRT
jgi:hypothetical protein